MPDIGRMIGQLWRLLPDDQKEVVICFRFKEKLKFFIVYYVVIFSL